MKNLQVNDFVFVGEQEDKKGSAGLFYLVNGTRRNPPVAGTKARRPPGRLISPDEGEWKFRGPTIWENAHLGQAGRLTGGEQFVITETPS